MAVDLHFFLDTYRDNAHDLSDCRSVTKEYQTLKHEYA